MRKGVRQPTTAKPAASSATTGRADLPSQPRLRTHRFFQDSVFLGDSITEALSFHDVLDEANVLAGAGKTAEFALEDIDELTKRSPKHIFIQLGSDDILWPTDDPKAYSLAHYAP